MPFGLRGIYCFDLILRIKLCPETIKLETRLRASNA